MRAASILPLSVAFLTLPLVAHTQVSGIGLKGGATYGRLASGKLATNHAPGATIGFYAPLGVAPRLEIQPELLASVLASGIQKPDGQGYTLRMMYLQMPLMVKYYMGNTFNVQGGPQMAILMMAQRTAPEGQESVGDRYNDLDVSANLGMGFDFPSGFDLTLRYQYGLKPITDLGSQGYPRHRHVQLTAGYRFTQFKMNKFTRKRP
jgi:hypothetical protein